MPLEPRFDLSVAKATALDAAREWGLELGEPFGSRMSPTWCLPAAPCSRSRGKEMMSRCTRATRSNCGTATARCDFYAGRGARCLKSARARGRSLGATRRRGDGDSCRCRITAVATCRIAVPAGCAGGSALARSGGARGQRARSARARAVCRSSTRGRTGSCMATSTTTTSFATAIGSSRSIRSRTSLIASTTCPRSSGTHSTTAWRIASRQSGASRRSSRQAWTSSGSARGR